VGWVWRGRLRAVVVPLVVSAVVPIVPTVPAVAGGKVPGIDVSMYQRRIDWRQVAATRVRFAIMRASLGNSHVDTKYRRNVAGATAHGLIVGAYHFAKPGRAPWDALAEADHFLRVARNAPGDVVPVLDIEDSGGLSRQQLWRWARRWLSHVRERTGLRPMIYSGNYFWTHYMGNTSWFARHGYPHWVAHWYVRRPDVPGRGWGGRGWTFWQWSATGRVPGIRGPVDLDWFGGRDLARSTISSITVVPAPGGTVLGPLVECGSGRTRCHRLANPGSEITLRARPAPGARLVRWTGACAAAGPAPTCRVTAVGGLAVSAVFERTSGTTSRGAGFATAAPTPPAVTAHSHCRANDPDCVIAALLSGGLGAQLGDLLPALLDAYGLRGATRSAAADPPGSRAI
jgi:GH25 family lysozyme M1 (1,4-beta-N-acetylmuramidase)